MTWRAVLALALLSVCGLPGCWSFAASAPPYAKPEAGLGGKREAVLLVSDAGIPFGDGSLADEILRALDASAALGRVYYPVIPRGAPALTVRVRAMGEFDESYVLGIISSATSGYFFIVPALIMPYLQWYSATCHVEVLEEGHQIEAFDVESKTRFVLHALFADPRAYRKKIRMSVQRDLANAVAHRIAEMRLQDVSPVAGAASRASSP